MSAIAVKKRKVRLPAVLLNAFFILLSLCYILPMLLVIATSLTSEDAILTAGFHIFPVEFSGAAYKAVFHNPTTIIRAYGVTFITAVASTALSLVVTGLSAYPLSRSNFRYKKIFIGSFLLSMLFGGSMIPTYIIYSKYYHLNNTIWVYIVPAMCASGYSVFMFRTFFRSIPESLFEAAKLDGARELYIFFKIVIPLSTAIFATVGFQAFVGGWNNYQTALIYIRDSKLYTLQYLLNRILNENEFLKSLQTGQSELSPIAQDDIMKKAAPTESLKFAMCVVAAGPMICIFPFFQKYFSKGMVVGSVKG